MGAFTQALQARRQAQQEPAPSTTSSQPEQGGGFMQALARSRLVKKQRENPRFHSGAQTLTDADELGAVLKSVAEPIVNFESAVGQGIVSGIQGLAGAGQFARDMTFGDKWEIASKKAEELSRAGKYKEAKELLARAESDPDYLDMFIDEAQGIKRNLEGFKSKEQQAKNQRIAEIQADPEGGAVPAVGAMVDSALRGDFGVAADMIGQSIGIGGPGGLAARTTGWLGKAAGATERAQQIARVGTSVGAETATVGGLARGQTRDAFLEAAADPEVAAKLIASDAYKALPDTMTHEQKVMALAEKAGNRSAGLNMLATGAVGAVAQRAGLRPVESELAGAAKAPGRGGRIMSATKEAAGEAAQGATEPIAQAMAMQSTGMEQDPLKVAGQAARQGLLEGMMGFGQGALVHTNDPSVNEGALQAKQVIDNLKRNQSWATRALNEAGLNVTPAKVAPKEAIPVVQDQAASKPKPASVTPQPIAPSLDQQDTEGDDQDLLERRFAAMGVDLAALRGESPATDILKRPGSDLDTQNQADPGNALVGKLELSRRETGPLESKPDDQAQIDYAPDREVAQEADINFDGISKVQQQGLRRDFDNQEMVADGNAMDSFGDQQLPNADPRSNPEAFGLPKRLAPVLKKRTAKQMQSGEGFDPNYHDILDFAALNGGLDRQAWEAEGLDIRDMQAVSRRLGHFGPVAFRRGGGMTPDHFAEKLRESGFSAGREYSGEELTKNDAINLINRAVRGEPIKTADGYLVDQSIQQIEQVKSDILRDRGIANEIGMPVEAMRAEISRQEALQSGLLWSKSGQGKILSDGQPEQGLTVESAREVASKAWGRKLIARAESAGVLNFVTAEQGRQMIPDLPADAKGFEVGGKAYIVADQVSAESVPGVVLHELGEHYGLPRLVGPELYGQILRQLRTLNGKDRDVTEAYDRVPDDTNPKAVDSEALAYLGEINPQHGLWQRMLDALRKGLNRLGIPTSFLGRESVSDVLRRLLRESVRNVKQATMMDQVFPIAREGQDARFAVQARHASPASFDRFKYNPQTAGTGEGEAKHGAGLYFSTHEDVQRAYAKQFARRAGGKAHQYDVTLSPDHEEFLDLDANFSDQTPSTKEKILAAAKSVGADWRIPADGKVTGREIYKEMSNEAGSDEAASEALKKAGVPGATYRDRVSRFSNSGELTSNYVLYDDSKVSIDRRYSRGVDKAIKERDEIAEKRKELLSRYRNIKAMAESAERHKEQDARFTNKLNEIEREILDNTAKFTNIDSLNVELNNAVAALQFARKRVSKEDTQSLKDYSEQYRQVDELRKQVSDAKKAGSEAGKLADKLTSLKSRPRPILDSGGFFPAYVEMLEDFVEASNKALNTARKIANWRIGREQSIDDATKAASEKRNKARSDVSAGSVVHAPDPASPVYWVYKDPFKQGGWREAAHRLRAAVQDRMIAVLDVQKSIEERTGALADAVNLHTRENLMSGRAGYRIESYDKRHIEPLANLMRRYKISDVELGEYLWVKHAKERNEHIAKVNPNMPDGGSGIETAEAERILALWQASPKAEQMEKLAQRVYAMTKETRQNMLNSGVISQTVFDAIDKKYKYYVPLRGTDEEGGEERGMGTGRGLDSRRQMIVRAGGRGAGNAPKNILGEIIGDARMAIMLGEKARVGRTLLRLALEQPNDALWKVEPVEVENKFSEAAGEFYKAVKNVSQEPGMLMVKVKGSPVKVLIKNKALADAVKNLNVEDANIALTKFAAINRYFSGVLTRYNPTFVLVNMARDLIFGMTNIYADHGAKAAAQVFMAYAPAMRAIYRQARGKAEITSRAAVNQEFQSLGGKTSFVHFGTVEQIQRDIAVASSTIRDLFKSGKPVRAIYEALARGAIPGTELEVGLRPMMKFIGDVNDTVENALRLAAFETLRKKGVSAEKAAQYAKDLTVNFTRRGAITNTLNALSIFFNASTQGIHAVMKALKKPKVMAALGGMATMQFSMAMYLMALKDDDGEPLWKRFTEGERARNICLGWPYIDDEGKLQLAKIKIPMPYGFNVFPSAGGRIAELVNDPDDKATDFIGDVMKSVAGAFSPLPITEGWSGLLGYLPSALVDLKANDNGFGGMIRTPEYPGSENIPRAYEGWASTPEIYKQTAQMLAWIGGGDEYQKPAAAWLTDWAPEDLRYLMGVATGGVGGFFNRVMSVGQKITHGIPTEPNDIPILSSFYGTDDGARNIRERYKEIGSLISSEKSRFKDNQRRPGTESDSQPESEAGKIIASGIRVKRRSDGLPYRVGKNGSVQLDGRSGSVFYLYSNAEKKLRELKDVRRSVYGDRKLSEKERAEKFKKLDTEENALRSKVVRAYNEQRKKRMH